MNSSAITLCFDFGNTRLKCAVFKQRALQEVLLLTDDSLATVQQLVESYQPQKTILSSVIHHNPDIETFLAQHSLFHLLGAQIGRAHV